MKREIKFKGKRSDTGEWIIGNLHLPNKLFTSPYICPDTTFGDCAPGFEDGDNYEEAVLQGAAIGRYFPVIPETIGEFTGLLDKNGKEIFESDIIKVYGQFEVPCEDKKDFEVINYEHIGTVVFNEGCFEFKNHLSKEKIIELQKVFEDATIDTDIISSLSSFLGIEILGNVFENPELLNT